MENETFQVIDGSHDWRTEIPNIIYSLKLSPYTHTLYSFYKHIAGDTGECFTKRSTIEEKTLISPAQQKKCEQELLELRPELKGKALIKITHRYREDGSQMTNSVEIEDIWIINYEHHLKKRLARSNRAPPPAPIERPPAPIERHNKNSCNKTHINNNNNPESPVVVVQIEDEEEKRKIIEDFNFDHKAIDELLKNPLQNFKDAILAMKEKKGKLDNPKGYIRNAINNGWKPEGKKNRFDLHTPSSKKEIEEDNEKFNMNLFVRNENKRNAELCIKYCLTNPNCKGVKEKTQIYPSTSFHHLEIGGDKIDFDMKNSEFMQKMIEYLEKIGYPISEPMRENIKYYQGKNI